MTRLVYDGFTITHDGSSLVRVVKYDVPDEAFDFQLSRAHRILNKFMHSKPGTTWGCDGIGYSIQRKKGIVEIKKSGVGPVKFRQGIALLRKEETQCPL